MPVQRKKIYLAPIIYECNNFGWFCLFFFSHIDSRILVHFDVKILIETGVSDAKFRQLEFTESVKK